jgi:hypothetical protein
MKNSVMKWRACAALALLAALAACGGYTAVNLGGSVTGLVTSGLILANGDATVTVPANATTYVFPSQIDDHGRFNVVIKQQPARYTCFMSNGSGLATGIPITSANVFCNVNTYTVRGTISGLTASGLVLVNGEDKLAIDSTASEFTFVTKVSDGSVYGIAVLEQPSNPSKQTCTVTNGTAFMGSANVTNVEVLCR